MCLHVMPSSQLQVALYACWYELILRYITNHLSNKIEKTELSVILFFFFSPQATEMDRNNMTD